MTTTDFDNILSPPAHRSLGASILERLREAIMNGHLAPGERLVEQSLADSMEVSRGPIREALDQLEREGLVLKRPNRGTFVARLAREDLDEVYSLRLALERLAIRQAIYNARPEHLEEMQSVIDTIQAYYARGITEQEAAELDVRFHDILCQASEHQRLYEFWSNLRPQIHIFLLSRHVAHPDFQELAVRSHQDILDAIVDGDEQQAVRRIEEHLRGAYERILAVYE